MKLDEIEDEFFEELYAFRLQMRRYGYAEWPEDSEMDVGSFVAEHRWGWPWKTYVPSRLWDRETPSCVVIRR
jgi:hypothetical protein